MRSTLWLALILCFSNIDTSLQWGKEGHKIVAQIAQNRLSKEASKVVYQFIGTKTLADIAPFPDDYDHSGVGRWSATCHYINLPRSANGFGLEDCGGCCVAIAINNYTDILSSQQEKNLFVSCPTSDTAEPCALTFLVHYIGDIHQPLHVSYYDDRGGNEVQASFFGKSSNLHEVWDVNIIQRWNSHIDSAVKELETMIRHNETQVHHYLSTMDAAAWANESYDYVLDTVYQYTRGKNGEAIIDEDYYSRNLPLIQQRLIAAGVRLSQVLNKVLVGN